MPKGIKLTRQITRIAGVDTVKQTDALKLSRDTNAKNKRKGKTRI